MPHHLGAHAGDRLHGRVFPGLPRPQPDWQIVLFLLCTIPFWTSNIIRMISWIPFLGRNGIANQTLISWGVIDEPLEWLLFRLRGDPGLRASLHAVHGGADLQHHDAHRQIADRSGPGRRRLRLQTLTNVIIPLTKPGIMIGSIFVVTLVMGDFITVRFMSGAIRQCRPVDLQRHRAAAIPLRLGDRGGAADHRADRDRHPAALRRYPEGAVRWSRARRSFYVLAAFFALFLLFLYGPTITIAILSFQGPQGGLTFPMNGVSLHWFRDLFEQQAVGDIWGSFPALSRLA
jgi:hypothetical protein